MKPSLALPFVLIAGIVQAQDTGFAPESVEPAIPIFTKPFITPGEEVPDEEETDDEEVEDEEPAEEESTDEEPDLDGGPVPDDEDPEIWFPGGPWLPDVIYTMTGGEEPVDDEELHPWDPLPGDIDPVIYQAGLPAAPKVPLKEKRANLQADIADGCEVTFTVLDGDESGSLDLAEFSTRRPGPAKARAKAFKRIDKNRDGALSLAEFSGKKSSLVMPLSMGLLEAAACRANFDALDFDGNGFLTYGEFTAVLRPSGPGILEAIFAEADRNGDGKISFAEYTHRPVNPAGVE